MTWDEIKEKYPEYRDEMSVDREREFVADCFDAYENEGFSKKFWSQGGAFKKYHGEPFKVLGRITEDTIELECLPMWKIQFENGFSMAAYPDEIIVREMKDSGCPEEYLS